MAKFQAGQSGNPAGRPKSRIKQLRAEIGRVTGDGATLIAALHEIVQSTDAQPRDRVAAAQTLLSYLVGMPERQVSLDGTVDVVHSRGLDYSAITSRLSTQALRELVEATSELNANDNEPAGLLEAGEPEVDE